MTTWTIELPDFLPLSMNKRERTHWATRKRELENLTADIGWIAKKQKIPKADARRYVHIVIHKSSRSRVTDDPGNRDSRSKACLDALVANGLLVDDSDRWLSWGGVIEGEKRAQKSTIITISDTVEAAAA